MRPLLHETRDALLQWATTHALTWIEDESNQDDTYDRNFLRLRVLPLLNQRWPHFAQAAARSAELCGEQAGSNCWMSRAQVNSLNWFLPKALAIEPTSGGDECTKAGGAFTALAGRAPCADAVARNVGSLMAGSCAGA